MTEIPTFDVGDLVRCAGEFRDLNNVLVDPSTVKFKFRKPDKSITEYTYPSSVQLVKVAVGKYQVDLDATATGTWFYRFFSTGSAQAAGEGEFRVAVSKF